MILKKITLKIILICFVFGFTNAQNFSIYEGDTINYTDENKIKEGSWIVFKKGTDNKLQEGNYLSGEKKVFFILNYLSFIFQHLLTL